MKTSFSFAGLALTILMSQNAFSTNAADHSYSKVSNCEDPKIQIYTTAIYELVKKDRILDKTNIPFRDGSRRKYSEKVSLLKWGMWKQKSQYVPGYQECVIKSPSPKQVAEIKQAKKTLAKNDYQLLRTASNILMEPENAIHIESSLMVQAIENAEKAVASGIYAKYSEDGQICLQEKSQKGKWTGQTVCTQNLTREHKNEYAKLIESFSKEEQPLKIRELPSETTPAILSVLRAHASTLCTSDSSYCSRQTVSTEILGAGSQ